LYKKKKQKDKNKTKQNKTKNMSPIATADEHSPRLFAVTETFI